MGGWNGRCPMSMIPCEPYSQVKRLFFRAKNSLANNQKAAVIALDCGACNRLIIRGLRMGR